MVFWDQPLGMNIFGHTYQFAKQSKELAMNQGLYNGFLSAGLLWGLSIGSNGESIKIFFLGCAIIAGTYGGWTVTRKIFFIQSLPAILALGLLLV